MTNIRKQVTIYTDGSYSMQTAVSAGAFLAIVDDKQVHRSFVLPKGNNVLAEFNAVKGAIAELYDSGVRDTDITVRTDLILIIDMFGGQLDGGSFRKKTIGIKGEILDIIVFISNMLEKMRSTISFKYIKGHSEPANKTPGTDAYFFSIVDQASRKTRKTGEEFYHVG